MRVLARLGRIMKQYVLLHGLAPWIAQSFTCLQPVLLSLLFTPQATQTRQGKRPPAHQQEQAKEEQQQHPALARG